MIAVFIIRHRHLAVLALASSKSEYDPLRKAALLVLNLGLHHRPDTNGGGPVRLQCLRTAPDHVIATSEAGWQHRSRDVGTKQAHQCLPYIVHGSTRQSFP